MFKKLFNKLSDKEKQEKEAADKAKLDAENAKKNG